MVVSFSEWVGWLRSVRAWACVFAWADACVKAGICSLPLKRLDSLHQKLYMWPWGTSQGSQLSSQTSGASLHTQYTGIKYSSESALISKRTQTHSACCQSMFTLRRQRNRISKTSTISDLYTVITSSSSHSDTAACEQPCSMFPVCGSRINMSSSYSKVFHLIQGDVDPYTGSNTRTQKANRQQMTKH